MEQLRLVRAPASSFSLASGSSGNSIFVGSQSASLLVDVGIRCKGLCQALDSRGIDPSELSGILITHEHSDHIKGLDVFVKKYSIPVYVNRATWKRMQRSLKYADLMDVRFVETGSRFVVGDIAVKSFATPHDAVESMGFRLDTGNRVVSVFTDLGQANEALLAEVAGSELIYIEANYDPEMLKNGPYPWDLKQRIAGNYGHLSNIDCGQAILELLKSGTNQFILSHLSEHNNYPELAELTVSRFLAAEGAKIGRDFQLSVAPRYQPGEFVYL